ncbi:MAG TPA: hypothetical protein VGB65_07315 [Allosphingosinicella sp.]
MKARHIMPTLARLRPLLVLAAAFFCLAAPASAAPAPEEAAAIVKRCKSPERAKTQACYAAVLEGRLGDGPAPALALLGELAGLDPNAREDGHMYAHRIGIAALTATADMGEVFASCTPSWQSGCYHGVIQSYFLLTEKAGGAIDAKSVDALCGGYRDKRADLLFQCTHGMGHGLEMLYRYDLPKALGGCDLLSRAFEQELCHAGAFMENIVNATQPHSTTPVSATATADPHAGHGGGHHAAPAGAAPAFRALDANDLHYPCSVVGERYMMGCYTIQTSAMFHHAGGDVVRVAGECMRAPEKARATCFVSLGRDVSTMALGRNAEAVRLCGLADAAFRAVCNRSVAEQIINMNADPAEGIPYCKAVPEADGKSGCYAAVGRQAMVLPDGEAKRAKACALAEETMRGMCLTGSAPATGA